LASLITRFRECRRWYDDIDDVELLLVAPSPSYQHVTAALWVGTGILAIADTVVRHILQR
jgi:hypothetical protein